MLTPLAIWWIPAASSSRSMSCWSQCRKHNCQSEPAKSSHAERLTPRNRGHWNAWLWCCPGKHGWTRLSHIYLRSWKRLKIHLWIRSCQKAGIQKNSQYCSFILAQFCLHSDPLKQDLSYRWRWYSAQTSITKAVLPDCKQPNSTIRLPFNGRYEVRTPWSLCLLPEWQVPDRHGFSLWGGWLLQEMRAVQHRSWSLVRDPQPQCGSSLPLILHLQREICLHFLRYRLVWQKVLQLDRKVRFSAQIWLLGSHKCPSISVRWASGRRCRLDYLRWNRHFRRLLRQIPPWLQHLQCTDECYAQGLRLARHGLVCIPDAYS